MLLCTFCTEGAPRRGRVQCTGGNTACHHQTGHQHTQTNSHLTTGMAIPNPFSPHLFPPSLLPAIRKRYAHPPAERTKIPPALSASGIQQKFILSYFPKILKIRESSPCFFGLDSVITMGISSIGFVVAGAVFFCGGSIGVNTAFGASRTGSWCVLIFDVSAEAGVFFGAGAAFPQSSFRSSYIPI